MYPIIQNYEQILAQEALSKFLVILDKLVPLYRGKILDSSYDSYDAWKNFWQQCSEKNDCSYLFAFWPDSLFHPMFYLFKPNVMNKMFFRSTITSLSDRCIIDASNCISFTNAFAQCTELTSIRFVPRSLNQPNTILSFQDCPLDMETIRHIQEEAIDSNQGGGSIYFQAQHPNNATSERINDWTFYYGVTSPELIVADDIIPYTEDELRLLAAYTDQLSQIYSLLRPIQARATTMNLIQFDKPDLIVGITAVNNGDDKEKTDKFWYSALQNYHYGNYGWIRDDFSLSAERRMSYRKKIMPFAQGKRWAPQDPRYFYIKTEGDDAKGLPDAAFNPNGFEDNKWTILNGYRLFEECQMTSISDRILLDLSQCVSLNRMFAECTNLRSIDQLLDFTKYSRSLRCNDVFKNCKNLHSIQEIKTRPSLEYIDVVNNKEIDASPFAGCSNLETVYFSPYSANGGVGIGASLNFKDCHKLSNASISSIIDALTPHINACITFSSQAINYLDTTYMKNNLCEQEIEEYKPFCEIAEGYAKRQKRKLLRAFLRDTLDNGLGINADKGLGADDWVEWEFQRFWLDEGGYSFNLFQVGNGYTELSSFAQFDLSNEVWCEISPVDRSSSSFATQKIYLGTEDNICRFRVPERTECKFVLKFKLRATDYRYPWIAPILQYDPQYYAQNKRGSAIASTWTFSIL